jgi:hypothetical protein
MAGAPTPRSAEGRDVLQHAAETLKKVAGVQGVVSYVDHDDSLFVLEDGSSLLIVGLDAAKNNNESDGLMRSLKRATDELQVHLRTIYPQLAFRWTGEALVNADLRRLSAASTRTAELTVFPLTLVVLLVAFRGLAAAALPLLSGAVTILVSLGLLTVLNRVWPVSIIVVSIISMVGLGLSIDYALLIVSRYRELVAAGSRRADAVCETLEHAGHTVIVSGSAVGIGFAAMLFVPVSDVRSIGLGGLLVTTVAVLAAISLLPTVLIRMDALIDGTDLAPLGNVGVAKSLAGACMCKCAATAVGGASSASSCRPTARGLAAGQRRFREGAARDRSGCKRQLWADHLPHPRSAGGVFHPTGIGLARHFATGPAFCAGSANPARMGDNHGQRQTARRSGDFGANTPVSSRWLYHPRRPRDCGAALAETESGVDRCSPHGAGN